MNISNMPSEIISCFNMHLRLDTDRCNFASTSKKIKFILQNAMIGTSHNAATAPTMVLPNVVTERRLPPNYHIRDTEEKSIEDILRDLCELPLSSNCNPDYEEDPIFVFNYSGEEEDILRDLSELHLSSNRNPDYEEDPIFVFNEVTYSGEEEDDYGFAFKTGEDQTETLLVLEENTDFHTAESHDEIEIPNEDDVPEVQNHLEENEEINSSEIITHPDVNTVLNVPEQNIYQAFNNQVIPEILGRKRIYEEETKTSKRSKFH